MMVRIDALLAEVVTWESNLSLGCSSKHQRLLSAHFKIMRLPLQGKEIPLRTQNKVLFGHTANE